MTLLAADSAAALTPTPPLPLTPTSKQQGIYMFMLCISCFYMRLSSFKCMYVLDLIRMLKQIGGGEQRPLHPTPNGTSKGSIAFCYELTGNCYTRLYRVFILGEMHLLL